MSIHMKLKIGIAITCTFSTYLQKYTDFDADIFGLLCKRKYGLSFDVKSNSTSGWALGNEAAIGTS